MMPRDASSKLGVDLSFLPNWVHGHERNDDADEASPSKREEIAREAAEHVAQQKRLSVRDLASKFEKDRAAAAQAEAANVRSDPRKGKGIAVHDTTVQDTPVQDTSVLDIGTDAQFNKLRLLLNDLRGRLSGRNKDNVEEALNATKALSATLTGREAGLAHERGEIQKIALTLKQSLGDAKRTVEEAHALAHSEIEAAKELAVRIQNALQEHEHMLVGPGALSSDIVTVDILTVDEKRELEELRRESHEARRIKFLHESSRTMDMEHQIDSLRQQLVDKSSEMVTLRSELEKHKLLGQEGGRLQWYRVTGQEQLGMTLTIGPVDDTVADLSRCRIQWYRITIDGSSTELILGAIRPQYAPEPFDVGKFLRAEIVVPSGKIQGVQTGGPIEPAPGLDTYVDVLIGKGGAQFNVRIVLENGETVKKQSLHTLDVNKTRIKLQKGRTVKAKEIYSASMQLCGARGGGDSAAEGLFWVATKDVNFMLVMESERERNAAILLARKFAKLNKIHLAGPDDSVPS